MIASGERPKKKNILEDLDLKRRALLLDSGEDLDEEELGSGIDEGDDRYYFDEDDDDFDYDGEDIEGDLAPGYDEFEDAEEPCPGLEPAGSATRVKYDRAFDENLYASEDDADRGDDDAVACQETAECLDVEETTVFEDADERVDDSEHYETVAADIEVSAASEEPEDASVSRRQYEEMVNADIAESEGHLQREELGELQTPDSALLEKELSPTIEVSPARDDAPEGGSESNLVEPMAAPAADGSGADVSGDCRAKLTLMKSEAAQRLDDLEKLIDEHQEIVEELKRTESNQGSLADLASMSPAASPVPFPAITPTEQLESRTVETPDPYAEDAAETPDPYDGVTAETRDSYTEETAETPDPYAGETAEMPDPRLPETADRAEADEQRASESEAEPAALHHVAEPAEPTPDASGSPALLSDTAGESVSADEYEDPGDGALQ